MDIRFLLVLLLPALTTAGSYSDGPMTYGSGYEDGRSGFDQFRGAEKPDVDEGSFLGYVGAEVLNENNAIANAAADDYGMKAKAIEQSAKWFRTLVNEKQLILSQVKKKTALLRAMAAEYLQTAEQFRKAAAEKSQTSKALESKAREAESLSKEQAVQGRELRGKMNNELKQHLESLISSNVAETNAETNLAELERHRAWGAYLEKQAQDMMSEAVKWEKRSGETLDKAKKLKTEASAENAKSKEFEKKRKEAEDAANEAEKKAHEFQYYQLEFHLKSEAEQLQAALARIKAKYLQMIVTSLVESASYMEMFGRMEDKDRALWEKRTASVRSEAKLLETSANKMLQNIEKLKASVKKTSSKEAEKKDETVVIETVKNIKIEPPKTEVKHVEAPKILVPEKKL